MRNPAFDVTPAELITGIVCEKGVVLAPEPGTAGESCSRDERAGVSSFMPRARHIRNISSSTYSGAP